MSSVKENIIKIKVLAALIGVNILKNNWRSMNWLIIVSNGRVSEEEYYISGSPAAIIVCCKVWEEEETFLYWWVKSTISKQVGINILEICENDGPRFLKYFS